MELRQVEPSVGSPTPESTAPIIETGSAKRDMSDFLLPSLLCCAAASGDKELVVEVLDKMPASTVNIADYDGRTPLHVAVEQKQVEVVVLLERGAMADLSWNRLRKSWPTSKTQSFDHRPSTASYTVASYFAPAKQEERLNSASR